MIVPFPAGGPNDTMAASSPRHAATLGQPVIIENVGGAARHDRDRAGRARGAGRLHDRPGQLGHARRQRRDLQRCPTTCCSDFAPIALLASNAAADRREQGTCRRTASKELIAWLKANPGQGHRWVRPAPAARRTSTGCSSSSVTGTRVPVRALSRRLRRSCRTWWRARSTSPSPRRSISLAPFRPAASRPTRSPPSSAAVSAGDSDRRGGRVAGLHSRYWHGLWAPKGTPKDMHRKAQCGGGRRRWRTPRCGAARRSRPGHLRRATSRRRRRWRVHRAEIEKWWPIIKAANVTGQ